MLYYALLILSLSAGFEVSHSYHQGPAIYNNGLSRRFIQQPLNELQNFIPGDADFADEGDDEEEEGEDDDDGGGDDEDAGDEQPKQKPKNKNDTVEKTFRNLLKLVQDANKKAASKRKADKKNKEVVELRYVPGETRYVPVPIQQIAASKPTAWGPYSESRNYEAIYRQENAKTPGSLYMVNGENFIEKRPDGSTVLSQPSIQIETRPSVLLPYQKVVAPVQKVLLPESALRTEPYILKPPGGSKTSKLRSWKRSGRKRKNSMQGMEDLAAYEQGFGNFDYRTLGVDSLYGGENLRNGYNLRGSSYDLRQSPEGLGNPEGLPEGMAGKRQASLLGAPQPLPEWTPELRQGGMMAAPIPTDQRQVGMMAAPIPTEQRQVGMMSAPIPTEQRQVGMMAAPIPTEQRQVGMMAAPIPDDGRMYGGANFDPNALGAEIGMNYAMNAASGLHRSGFTMQTKPLKKSIVKNMSPKMRYQMEKAALNPNVRHVVMEHRLALPKALQVTLNGNIKTGKDGMNLRVGKKGIWKEKKKNKRKEKPKKYNDKRTNKIDREKLKKLREKERQNSTIKPPKKGKKNMKPTSKPTLSKHIPGLAPGKKKDLPKGKKDDLKGKKSAMKKSKKKTFKQDKNPKGKKKAKQDGPKTDPKAKKRKKGKQGKPKKKPKQPGSDGDKKSGKTPLGKGKKKPGKTEKPPTKKKKSQKQKVSSTTAKTRKDQDNDDDEEDDSEENKSLFRRQTDNDSVKEATQP